jgi:hypothetical protein
MREDGQATMKGYQTHYRRAFQTLGRRLKPDDKVPERELHAAEKRLGIQLPKSLADYYRSAGGADDYNLVFERLVPPGELEIEGEKLVFMEEHQAVVLWGTDAGADGSDDPPVNQATHAEPLIWERVSDRCSEFLLIMVCWAGAFAGAMPYANTAVVDEDLVQILDRDWSFVGEVNGLRAYTRPGMAICFLKWEDCWRIFAGASSEAGMHAIAAELRVAWEQPIP